MKKFLIIFGLVLGFASAVYAAGSFCCSGSKEKCCADRGKVYCPNENVCRTRCKCAPDECCGCINPNGDCCDWCPTAEVCAHKGLCQRIVNGCYTCDICDPDCPSPKCLNEEGVCCDSCPRVCPEGQCLVEDENGCYECGECNKPTPTPDDDDDVGDDDVDDDEPTTCTGACEVYENGACVDKTTTKWTGECCNEGTVACCPLTEGDCNCYPNAEICGDDDDDDDDDDISCDDLTWDEGNCEYCEDGEVKSRCTDGTQCCGGECTRVVCDPCEVSLNTGLSESYTYSIYGIEQAYAISVPDCPPDNICGDNEELCCTDGKVCCEGMVCCPTERCMSEIDCTELGLIRKPTGDGCYECSGCQGKEDCGSGQVCCGGKCTTPPTPDASKCEESSEDGCSIVSKCTSSQECCGGECIAKCDATTCLSCNSSTKKCESSCGSGDECCKGECYSKCPEDKVRNSETCVRMS